MGSGFPGDFMWGASTAGHQVDGGAPDQWTDWEAKNADRLARTARKRMGELHRFGILPNWETIAEEASRPDNYISGSGLGHYDHYEQDFKLLKSLHLNALRFSIEWARLEPKPGEWDAEAIEHYRLYIAKLKGMGIEPIPTLWHWTVPIWFANRGGFTRKRNLQYFETFVAKVAELYGRDLRYVLVLNEPNVYAGMSYALGHWPPQTRNLFVAVKVFFNLVRAHRSAYRLLKRTNPGLQVGMAISLCKSYPVSPRNPVNRIVVHLTDFTWNWWFLNRIRRSQDFVGINFYVTHYVDWRWRLKDPPHPVSDFGTYLEPGALYDLLLDAARRYDIPIIVTETGVADANDVHRKWWIKETLSAMEKAAAHGVRLKGYLHWSLIDNFEWSFGWWPKFGLVAVDRTTLKRKIRPSARWFANHIRSFAHRQG